MQPIGGVFGQYWSFFVEIHFHLLFTILFVLFVKDSHRIKVSLLIVILTFFVFRPLTSGTMVRFATHAHLDGLFLGVLFSYIGEEKRIITRNIPAAVKQFISLSLIVLLVFAPFYFDTYFNNINIKYFVYTLLASALFLLARENNRWIIFSDTHFFRNVLVRLGNASASTYASHIILYSGIFFHIYSFYIPERYKTENLWIFLMAIILCVSACIVGELSYRWIEKPYNVYRKNVIKNLMESCNGKSSVRKTE